MNKSSDNVKNASEPAQNNLTTLIDITKSTEKKPRLFNILYSRYPPYSGEVSINGELIPNSHVIDIIRHLVSPTNANGKQPEGFERFSTFLQTIHVPKSFKWEREREVAGEAVNQRQQPRIRRISGQQKQ